MSEVKVIEDLLKYIQENYKHDVSATTPTTNLVHGTTGIFGAHGVDPQIISTRVQPRGLTAVLPARSSIDTEPIVGYLTGFTDDETAAEKNGVCDDPLEAGLIKSCYQTSAFGRIERRTSTLDLSQLGKRGNRAEFLDLTLLNEPLMQGDFSVPSTPSTFAEMFRSEINARLMVLGAAFQEKIGSMNWIGNPANNTAGGGYREYNGLERLVKTGFTDVLTGASCPSLNSYIRDFNYGLVSDTMTALMNELTFMYRYLRHNASRMRLEPVDWRLVMRPELFNEIIDRWPCTYATYRCAGSEGNPNGTDAMVMREMALDMYNGQYLRIDNVRIPVILDDYLPEETNLTNPSKVPAGQFASDIYLLPFSARGAQVLFYEYFDHSQAYGQLQQANVQNFWTSDGGRFMWTTNQTGWCVQWLAKIEPRLRLLTPHLAGRLENVRYAPLMHFRSPSPDSSYFVDGGNTVGNWSDLYR